MTTTPDFRALCAELTVELEDWMFAIDRRPAHSVELVDSARTALATPPPEPPTDDELDRCLLKADSDFMDSLSPFGGPFYHQAKDRFKARAVLERWGK